ncbi:MAG: serine/threonine protein phosphatase [Alphaproteobacteria bacterium]|nr:serine/threonine protein phosphatase [Alphaproteobacteria bacterium]
MNWRSLFREDPHPTPRMAEGVRVYAIGDVHGRLDLLLELSQMIKEDLQENPVDHSVELFLGDYIDRGPESREVLDYLLTSAPVCNERICLKGNHEQTLLEFLEDPDRLKHWARYGGMAMMRSYGIAEGTPMTSAACKGIHRQFVAKFPDEHFEFCRDLPTSVSLGDYFFAHAGVRPGVPLEDQSDRDLMWIRDDFLTSTKYHGKFIVHGHTPARQPEVHTNRINIDTCAYGSGILTSLVLEDEGQGLLATGAPGPSRLD